MSNGQPPRHIAANRSAASPRWGWLALLLLALIAAAPLWTGPGLVNTRSGGDSPFLFIRLHQLVENLRAGVFPARWMPDAAYGLGYPLFNFYAALPYTFAALFNLLGFDLLASIKIVQSLGFVLAAWAMYGWVSSAGKHTPEANRIAWLAAAAYTVAPFHLVNVYVRGDSLSEFYAFAFYPLILWAIERVMDRPGARSIAWLGLAYGGLILTHNVSALIFSPFVLLYILMKGMKDEGGRMKNAPSDLILHPSSLILRPLLGMLLGLLVSAWFWLPALGEAPLVQLDVQTTGYFNYNEHFRSTDLIQASVGFDYDTEPPHTPFAMGLVQALGVFAGGVCLLATWRRGATGLRAFVLLGLIVSTLMITPLSRPLWDALPLLPLTQFPWRFLSIQTLFASVAIGYLATVGSARTGRTVAVASALALVAATLLPLRPDYLPIRADEITPERIQLYEAFTTNIGTTIRAEYLPRSTIPRPYTGPALIDPSAPPRAIPIRGQAQAAQVSRGPTWHSWSVNAAGDSALALPTLYFPGWRASIDGQPIEARAAADLGYIEVDVPAGQHTLTLWLDRTPLRAGAEIVSAASLLLTLGLLARRRQSTTDDRRSSFVVRLAPFVSGRRYEIALLALAALLAAVASAANTVDPRDDDLTMDFESMPWLHHGGADLGAARLESYVYTGSFSPGRFFTLALDWADTRTPIPNAALSLVAPSHPAFGLPQPLASIHVPIREGANSYTLDLPDVLAPGLYYVSVAVPDTTGQARTVYLRPIVYDGSAAAPGSPAWARIAGEIELKTIAVAHEQPDRLTLAFDWAALKPIAANYAVSLRLQDAGGRIWVSHDSQPGYGFLPTSAWQPNETQHDMYTLSLPSDAPREGDYALDVVWYRVASQEEIGRVRVPGIKIDALYGETEVTPPPRVFDAPSMQHRVDATFGGVIRLLGYDMSQAGSKITLTLHWQALADIGTDYKFFVHVFDPATERIAAQVDARPGGGAYPTSRWVKGEVVTERVELELERGVYRVATGWYDPATRDRLPAIDSEGQPLPDNRFIFDEVLSVP